MCCFFVSLLSLFFPCSPPLPFPPLPPRSSILSRTGRKENQEASNLAVPMTMCLFPVPFPLTPSLRPQVSSINPTVTRSLLYSVLRDAPSDRGGQGQQSRDAQLSEYPSLDYQGLYVTLVTLLDLVPLLQHGQHGESRPSALLFVIIILEPSGLHEATAAFLASFVTGREKSCWGSWGMHGVIGSTLDPVNLIVHKPLDTPDIGLLLCIIADCMFVL